MEWFLPFAYRRSKPVVYAGISLQKAAEIFTGKTWQQFWCCFFSIYFINRFFKFSRPLCVVYCCRVTIIKFNRSEEHTSELQSRFDLVCRLLLEKKNT